MTDDVRIEPAYGRGPDAATPAPCWGPALPVTSVCLDLSSYGSTADAGLLVASAPLDSAPGPSVQVPPVWLYSSL